MSSLVDLLKDVGRAIVAFDAALEKGGPKVAVQGYVGKVEANEFKRLRVVGLPDPNNPSVVNRVQVLLLDREGSGVGVGGAAAAVVGAKVVEIAGTGGLGGSAIHLAKPRFAVAGVVSAGGQSELLQATLDPATGARVPNTHFRDDKHSFGIHAGGAVALMAQSVRLTTGTGSEVELGGGGRVLLPAVLGASVGFSAVNRGIDPTNGVEAVGIKRIGGDFVFGGAVNAENVSVIGQRYTVTIT